MPVRFKASSEYDRNFKWRTSYAANEDASQISKWAGLRSDELGIHNEPSFPSKRRVPYYHPQISKSFQWKETDDYAVGRVKLGQVIEKESLDKEKIITPDAPRLKKKARSKSAVPRIENNNGHSAAPRMPPSEGHAEVAGTKPVKGNLPAEGKRHTEDKYEKASVPKKDNKEADGVHRVLQKKAGMRLVPSHHPLRTSEYQRQFERKTGTDNSPLLAAEQVVHNKNNLVPPFKLHNHNIETEYKSQFKGSPPAKGPKLRKDWEDKHHTEYDQDNGSPKRKDKRKAVGEWKSDKENSPDKEQKEIDQRNVLKEKILKQLYTPKKCYRKAKTEYSANFLSPSDYRYKDGAWIKAKHQLNQDSLSVGSMWVAEVKELREKAEYYRHRAEGTHFSRNHLNQIISANNRFWDVSSTTSSGEDMSNNIKALDLAGLHSSSRNESMHQSPTKSKAPSNTGNLGVSDVSTLPVRRKLAWDDCEDEEEEAPLRSETEAEEAADAEDDDDQGQNNTEEHEHIKEKRPNGTKLSSPEDESECASVTSGVGGRLPTPKLKTFGLAQRTHHDLTTPATGGALLVSPSKNHQYTPEQKHKGSSKNYGSPKKIVSKGVNERNPKRDEESAQSPPVAGLKTVDPLPIREDPWPNPHIPNKSATITYPLSRPVDSPYVPLPRQWSPSCRIHGTLRDPEFQHNGNFNSIGYYSSARNDVDGIEDDRLSQISARSEASSSLASQVLERAQKRKENFWGNK